jgi:hypothetical protein
LSGRTAVVPLVERERPKMGCLTSDSRLSAVAGCPFAAINHCRVAAELLERFKRVAGEQAKG